MRKIAVAIFLLLFAGLASAQIPTSGNIFVGYSYENASSTALSTGFLSRPNLQGWDASLEGKIFPHLGIVTDVSGHYGSENFSNGSASGNVNGHELDVLFGPRLSIPIGKLTPFGEVMIGVAHVSVGGSAVSSTGTLGSLNTSNTSFATAFGGGLDYKIIRPIALRLEVDEVRTNLFSTWQNNLRISTGVVFRF